MLEEEKTLKERFGNENHFSVPEGYFKRLTAEVMANCQSKRHRWFRYRLFVKSLSDHSIMLQLACWLSSLALLYI